MDQDRLRTQTAPRSARWCWLLALACAPCLADAGSAAEFASAQSSFSVIELPPQRAALSAPGPQRSRHALSFATDTPKTLLRSLGVDASDCSMHLRLPSRLKAPAVGTARQLEIQAQAGLACRF